MHMNKRTHSLKPDYKKIYTDILAKYPERRALCKEILCKENLSEVDIINLNQKIFGLPDKETKIFNQRHRSYTKPSILTILDYQQKYKLNNVQLAHKFNISRNTITKWKRIFLE